MPSDKLISLLKVFSKYALNRLRKFILSPYFNDQEEVVALFDLLNQALRKGDEVVERLSKADLWKALYPKRPFDDAHLRRLMSDLHQLALQFLVQEHRAADPVAESLDLHQLLEHPEWKKQLTSVERQLERYFETNPAASVDFYLSNYQLHRNIVNRAYKTVAAASYVDKLADADYHLECFYAVQKLKFYIGWLLFRGFRSTTVEIPLPPGFFDYLAEPRFDRAPLVRIYKQAVLCLLEPNQETYFTDLLDLLERHSREVSEGDLRECYQIAQNYCAIKINQGRTEYYAVNFSVFKTIIRLGVLLEKDQLQESIFKNIITSSLRVGEYAWAEQFINDYAGYLPSDIRENARTFNLANLYSHQKQYDRVIELLRNVEYSDVVYALSAKLILVRTYYETGEFLALDSLVDSFRIFLRRNNLISKNFKTEYNNFLGFVKKMSMLAPGNAKTAARLHEQISRCTAVVSKKWLLEQAAQLMR